LESAVYESPFGPIELGVRGGKLARVELRPRRCARGGGPTPAAARRFLGALDRYFSGGDSGLRWADVDLSGATPFRQKVFRELMAVPFGAVVTYGELAERVGVPRGARAVGGAVGSNPVPIIIPCHRVVRAGRGLGGFGAGLGWKKRLLRHEGWSVKEGKVQ